jgi:hypothetical protein
MALEQLLDSLALDVDAFALCDVSPGWSLDLDGRDTVTLHFVLEGEGRLRAERGPMPLRSRDLALVPPRTRHSLESGEALERTSPMDTPGPDGMMELRAGPGGGDPHHKASGPREATSSSPAAESRRPSPGD